MCRSDLAGQRDRALLLAAGLGRGAVVVLQAEQLRFSEPGLALTVSGGEDTPRTQHLSRAAPAASRPVRAVENWLRASATRYGPVFRKINRWDSSSMPPSAPTLSVSSWRAVHDRPGEAADGPRHDAPPRTRPTRCPYRRRRR